MDFNNIDEIKKAKFSGFRKMNELFNGSFPIPKMKGIYLVLNPNYKKAEYLQIGTGGYFKGKNPNVSLEELKSNWVDNSLFVYIGKAGNETSKATLNSRLKQCFGFGQGKNIGHWGGRLIWQLKNANDTQMQHICFCPTHSNHSANSQLFLKSTHLNAESLLLLRLL